MDKIFLTESKDSATRGTYAAAVAQYRKAAGVAEGV